MIGRENGEAAAVAQDGHARPLRSWGHRQDLDRIEELIEAVDTQHPGAAEHGLVDRIGAGHRARVRGRGARALGVATRLDDDGGFHPGGGPGRRHEFAGRGHRLDVEQDGAGVGIAREVVEQIPEIHIRHVPQGDEVREADAALLGPVHHRGDDGPRLRDEGDGALRRIEMGEARVEPDPRDQDTEAVRADDAQETGPRGIEQCLLALSTGGLLGFSETGGDDDCGPRALPPERLYNPRHGVGRGTDDRKVRHQRQGLDGGISEHPLDGLVFGIHGHDGPVESTLEEVPGEHRPDGPGPFAGADERHGSGLKGEFQVANAHREATLVNRLPGH